MLHELKKREAEGRPIQVGLVGVGAMGRGIAFQIAKTPGMRLSFIADHSAEALANVASVYPEKTILTLEPLSVLEDDKVPCDVLVEATNSIIGAYDYCMAAIRRKAHCVLMNAEVDAILGFLLQAEAKKQGVIVTSDAGDQHGVLARMMNEIEMWGFEMVQAGNMKGFLHRHRDMEGTVEVAKKLNLSVQQCLAYTDGSKLNIEMSIIANEYGLTPMVAGMEGPRANKVQEVIDVFDFDKYQGQGRVDYILGASEHGGGVYVVAKTESEFEQGYMNYYKVTNRHPYYVFMRPYHLCHLETPRAVALACLYGKAVCTMAKGRVTDTYAYVKKDLKAGDRITHAIGSDEVYGLIDEAKRADAAKHVPQGVLDVEDSDERPVLKRAVKKDEPLTWDDVEIPAGRMTELWEKQKSLLGIA